MSKKILPYGHQHIDEQDIHYVNEVLKSEWLTTGPVGPRFESEFSNKTGSKYSLACSSGTAALHLAVLARVWPKAHSHCASDYLCRNCKCYSLFWCNS